MNAVEEVTVETQTLLARLRAFCFPGGEGPARWKLHCTIVVDGMAIKKKMLIVFSVMLVILAVLAAYGTKQVRATLGERAETIAGDGLIPQPIGVVNHAITIYRSPHDVWPWLVQMGSGRAGWYTYDFIDNRGHHSADRILPEFQNIEVGSVFPALPGARDVFTVVQYDPEHNLVLSWQSPSGKYLTTWAFVLKPLQPNATRLIVRGRVASDYHPYGLPQWVALLLARPAHFIMERKQLLGIARRAESVP